MINLNEALPKKKSSIILVLGSIFSLVKEGRKERNRKIQLDQESFLVREFEFLCLPRKEDILKAISL